MKSQIQFAVTLVFVATLTGITAKTVVFYPLPLTSYIVYHSSLAGALASLGHDVWICVPASLTAKHLIQDKSINTLVYGEYLGDIVKQLYEQTRIAETFWMNETFSTIKLIVDFSKTFVKVAEVVLADQIFVRKVRNLKPDLIVLESTILAPNMVVLPYMLDIPFALVGTAHDPVQSKIPFSPATTPYCLFDISEKMTFFQRLQMTLFYFVHMNFELFYDSSLVAKFAPHKPYKTISQLVTEAEIFIAEVDHILDYPRTVLPNTKLIGGSSTSPAKPLSGEFKKFVDESKNGVVVMSFGSSVTNVPSYIVSKIASAFRQLNQSVIWRINIVSPDPKQILTSTWVPQNDLLGHEKTKLFVSHCGKNGQYEALYHGVPMLCLPIYADQPYNSERVVVKHFGLRADMRQASADELAAIMKEIIYNKTYTENIQKASRLYRELYKLPKQEAAYWLDHVMKYGGEYMRSPGQKMPWYQIMVLDVVVFIIAVIAVLIFLMMYFIVKLWRCVFTDGQRFVKRKRE
ncbi:unnamed protein product [Candidula unifasciata]|uniref:UDP-glucuronosyltransferase n=1 Tax=Candidula unifasciata TaxID=100452 RepID=A0A8S3YVM6_9EUPU|nr:unnamed protein product [Candidula unifasciata]